MTSWQHKLVVGAATAVGFGRVLWRAERTAHRAQRAFVRNPHADVRDAPPPRLMRHGLRVERETHAGWPVWVLRSLAREASSRVIVYLHGGSYVGQIGWLHWSWITGVARRTGARVVIPLYPLAPFGTAATVVPATADLVSGLLEEFGAADVTVIGDSAGGGLALAAVQELMRRGGMAPDRLVLIAPWLDADVSDPASAAVRDPILTMQGLRASATLWAGDLPLDDPRVSPLFGSLDGLPRISVWVGTRDILCPDAVRLAERAEREGAALDLTVRDGLVHGWPIIGILPEARAARPDIDGALLGRATPGSDGRSR